MSQANEKCWICYIYLCNKKWGMEGHRPPGSDAYVYRETREDLSKGFCDRFMLELIYRVLYCIGCALSNYLLAIH